MRLINLQKEEVKEPVPGYKVNFIHSDNMTFAHWDIEEEALLPEHSHPHEQVTNLIEGEFEITIDSQTRTLKPRQVVIIPPNAVHSGKALTACKIIDVFYPIREDYR